MTIRTFILKNALRNKRRATLSVLSVAVSLFLLVTLMVGLRELTMPPEDMGAALRVAVRNKISIANLLPARQRPIIERIPGVEALTPFTWFGGKYKNEENMTFAQFAMDATKLRDVFGEAKMSGVEYEAFEKERTGCIMGKISADKYGLKVGDTITLESTIYPCTLDFKIVGIYSGTSDDRNMLFRQDYLDEASGLKGYVGMWWLRVRSAEDMPRVTEAINKAFENTSAEVLAESERAFQLGFISMWGNIKMLITIISSAVVFALMLVSASTMSMAIRERFRELAILKAIGFRRRELFALILAESFGLAAGGALLGVGGAWLVFTHTRAAGVCLMALGVLLLVRGALGLRRRAVFGFLGMVVLAAFLAYIGKGLLKAGSASALLGGMLPLFEVTPRIMATASAVAAVLGVVSSLAPSLSVARMSVVEGLKTLD